MLMNDTPKTGKTTLLPTLCLHEVDGFPCLHDVHGMYIWMSPDDYRHDQSENK